MTVKKILDNIIEWRERKKQYSQAYLAQRMGMTQKAYSKIETGDTKLTVHHLIQIADILEIEINELLELKPNVIYHNHQTHNGEGIVINKKSNDDTKELYDKLLVSKDREIDILHKYIARLEQGESDPASSKS